MCVSVSVRMFVFVYVCVCVCTCALAAEEVNDPLVICRVYACIADMLAFMAKEGGIRGGPAANKAWRIAFTLLEVHTSTVHQPILISCHLNII